MLCWEILWWSFSLKDLVKISDSMLMIENIPDFELDYSLSCSFTLLSAHLIICCSLHDSIIFFKTVVGSLALYGFCYSYPTLL